MPPGVGSKVGTMPDCCDSVREVDVGPEPVRIDGHLLDRVRLRILMEGQAVVPGRLGLFCGVDEGDGRREVLGGNARGDCRRAWSPGSARACPRRVRPAWGTRVAGGEGSGELCGVVLAQPLLWALRPVARLLGLPTPRSRCRRSPGLRRCSPRRSSVVTKTSEAVGAGRSILASSSPLTREQRRRARRRPGRGCSSLRAWHRRWFGVATWSAPVTASW